MDYPDHTPYGICTCDACEKNQLRQRVAELEKERDALLEANRIACEDLVERHDRIAELKQQRDEQVAAQTAVIEKLTKRLVSTNIIIEVVCAIHPDSACAKYELAENMNALAIPTDSTTSPLEIEL